jgi:Rha family phage regulatory protein
MKVANLVFIADGKVWTDSLKLAETFNKEHKTVLRKIEHQLTEYSAGFTSAHFCADVRQVEIGQGAERESKFYRLTRNGFNAVAMTFTGKKAAAFREVILAEFDRMESELIGAGLQTKAMSKDDLLDLMYERNKELRTENIELKTDVNTLRNTVTSMSDNVTQTVKMYALPSRKIKDLYPHITFAALSWFDSEFSHNRRSMTFKVPARITIYLNTVHKLSDKMIVAEVTRVQGVADLKERALFNKHDLDLIESKLEGVTI